MNEVLIKLKTLSDSCGHLSKHNELFLRKLVLLQREVIVLVVEIIGVEESLPPASFYVVLGKGGRLVRNEV